MSTQPVIVVDHVTKEFVLHGNETILSRAIAWAKKKERPKKLIALEDISFSVQEGEVIGLIGRNGTGKSTLLRVIAGIYKPNRGSVFVRGKLIPLINLQVGLRQRLTMRDNIYLFGALLGMSQEGIKEKFNEIVKFSELDNLLDTQVYKFSDGMKSRLAFSIAVHTDPEILLLDEVFQAGDMSFRQKSRKKMLELVSGDTTVVLASHQEDLICSAVDRVLWLDRGRILMEGSPREVSELYRAEIEMRRAQRFVRRKKLLAVTRR